MKKKEGYQVKEESHFDRLAEAKGQIWWGSDTAAGIRRLSRRAKFVFQWLCSATNPNVLELGCGTGAFSRFILQELPLLRLTCCDISKKSVELAARRYSDIKMSV